MNEWYGPNVMPTEIYADSESRHTIKCKWKYFSWHNAASSYVYMGTHVDTACQDR